MQAGESAAADKAQIAQLQLQIQQLSKQTLVPRIVCWWASVPPQDLMRLVAKAMQSSPAELEQMLPLPVGFSPLGQSEAQASASFGRVLVESDGTGGLAEMVPHGTPTYVRGIALPRH